MVVAARLSPSGQALESAADTYGFSDDFDVGIATGVLIPTGGATLTTGAGNWSIRAINNTGSFQLGYGSIPAEDPEHPGQLRFFTGNIANDAWVLVKNQNGQTTGQIFSQKIDELEWVVLQQNTSQTLVRVQLFAATLDASYAPSSNIMQMSLDTSDAVSGTTWVARQSGSSPINTGIGPATNSTNWWKVKLKRNDASVDWYINGVLRATFGAGPTGQVATGVRCQTLTGAQRFLTIDKISLVSKSLNR